MSHSFVFLWYLLDVVEVPFLVVVVGLSECNVLNVSVRIIELALWAPSHTHHLLTLYFVLTIAIG